jgi:hypothetical protein
MRATAVSQETRSLRVSCLDNLTRRTAGGKPLTLWYAAGAAAQLTAVHLRARYRPQQKASGHCTAAEPPAPALCKLPHTRESRPGVSVGLRALHPIQVTVRRSRLPPSPREAVAAVAELRAAVRSSGCCPYNRVNSAASRLGLAGYTVPNSEWAQPRQARRDRRASVAALRVGHQERPHGLCDADRRATTQGPRRVRRQAYRRGQGALAGLQVEKANIDGRAQGCRWDLGPIRYLVTLLGAKSETALAGGRTGRRAVARSGRGAVVARRVVSPPLTFTNPALPSAPVLPRRRRWQR